jgi:hypothetical protein
MIAKLATEQPTPEIISKISSVGEIQVFFLIPNNLLLFARFSNKEIIPQVKKYSSNLFIDNIEVRLVPKVGLEPTRESPLNSF